MKRLLRSNGRRSRKSIGRKIDEFFVDRSLDQGTISLELEEVVGSYEEMAENTDWCSGSSGDYKNNSFENYSPGSCMLLKGQLKKSPNCREEQV